MSEKSSSRKEERRDQRRKEILDVASRLFSRLGYENVTLRAIADEMGYAHAALYRYFPDKSHLLAEICRETFDRLIVELDDIAQATSEPEERLFNVSRGVVQFGLTHPQHFRAVFFGPEYRDGVRVGDHINEIGRSLFKRLVRFFGECVDNSGITVEFPLLAAHTWWSAMFGLTIVLIIQGQLPDFSEDDRVVEQAITTMWLGLKAASASQPMLA